MLVHDAGIDIGESNIRIVKLSKVVLMDHLPELVLETLCHRLEGVVVLLHSL